MKNHRAQGNSYERTKSAANNGVNRCKYWMFWLCHGLSTGQYDIRFQIWSYHSIKGGKQVVMNNIQRPLQWTQAPGGQGRWDLLNKNRRIQLQFLQYYLLRLCWIQQSDKSAEHVILSTSSWTQHLASRNVKDKGFRYHIHKRKRSISAHFQRHRIQFCHV